MMKTLDVRKGAIVSGAIALVALTLTGCGSSKPSSSSGTTATTSPAPTGSPIGLVVFSGFPPAQEADDADNYLGVQVAIKWINSHGGINGHPLNSTYCADNYTPSQATTCAQNAVNDSSVMASVSQYSGEGSVIDPILQQAGMAAIGDNAFGGADFTTPIIFTFNNGAFSGLVAVAGITDELHGKKVSVLYPDNAAGATLAPLINSTVLKPRGLSLLNAVAVPATSQDMSSYVSKANAGSPDGIVTFLGASQAHAALKTARQLGINTPFVLPGAAETVSRIQQELGNAASNLYLFDNYKRTGPMYNKLVSQMKAAGNSADSIDANVITGWLSVQLFEQVAKGLPTVTRSGVLSALQNLSNFDTGGLTPPISFTTPGTALGGKAPRIFNVSGTMFQYTNGAIQPVNGGAFINPFTPPSS